MKLNQIVWNPFFTTLFTDNYQITLQNLHLRFYPPFQAILVIFAIFINQKNKRHQKKSTVVSLLTFALFRFLWLFFSFPEVCIDPTTRTSPREDKKKQVNPVSIGTWRKSKSFATFRMASTARASLKLICFEERPK